MINLPVIYEHLVNIYLKIIPFNKFSSYISFYIFFFSNNCQVIFGSPDPMVKKHNHSKKDFET
jgi:hypothetical protein